MPCGILRRGHAGRIYPAEKFFGKPQLPAAQPDVDVGKQGDAADILRPDRGGQPVKAVDVISRRIQLVGHVILRHGEQAPRPVAGVAGTRHLPAQAVVLRLPPLLVTILAGKFRIQPFQHRFGLERVFRVPRTSCEENARQKHPQEAGSGGKGSQHHGFGFCVRQK